MTPTHLGVVAAGDERTAEAGVEILRAGGNAVDAAVAATLVAFVAEPMLTGPFGGGFASVGGAGATPRIYDCFSNAPGLGLDPGAGPGAPKLDFSDVVIDFGGTTQVFHGGRGAYACSALLPGLLALAEERGRLPMARVAAPAIALSHRGAQISPNIAGFIRVLEPLLHLSPQAEALFAPGGRLLEAGDPFVNPDLEGLLARVGRGEAPIAPAALLEAFGPPQGRLTAADLAACAIHRRAPICAPIADCEVLLNPPPSAGGTLIAFGLRLLAGAPASVWRNATQTARHLVAAMAVSNAARAEGLDRALLDGEGEVAERFLADAHLDRWREPFARALREGPAPEAPVEPVPGSTTHLSIVDGDGLACAITSSNGEGCGHLVPGAGAMANNFMGEEDLHPQGLLQHPAGRRLVSMMCPTVVLRDGAPVLVLGSGGSNRIRTALLQVMVRHLLCGQPLTEAVCAPRLHYEGDSLYLERRGCAGALSGEVLDDLAGWVPKVVPFDGPNVYFGGVHAVDGGGQGAGDPRRGGILRQA